MKKKFIDKFSEHLEGLDLNSRQVMFQRLIRERGFFETVCNTIEDGLLVTGSDLKLRYHNRAAVEMLALPQDVSQIRLSQLIPGVNWQQLQNPETKKWVRAARQELEICYPEPRYIQCQLAPLANNSDLAIVVLHDVTETRKRTGAELEKETVKAVSLLAAGVAHEIGNPLNGLYLNLQILERAFAEPECNDLSASETLEMLECCKSEVERLDSIIHSFLTAIRPGKMEFKPVDLREVVVDVLNFMRPEIESRKVDVKCQWGEVLPPVPGDREQLKQAFYNIIRNAVQAMSNGGELSIFGYSTPEFRILEFADSGRGMSSDDLREMFVPFHTAKASGNGIGTMVIERVCREHGADFGVITEEERGTVFQLRFPTGSRRVRLLPASGDGEKVESTEKGD